MNRTQKMQQVFEKASEVTKVTSVEKVTHLSSKLTGGLPEPIKTSHLKNAFLLHSLSMWMYIKLPDSKIKLIYVMDGEFYVINEEKGETASEYFLFAEGDLLYDGVFATHRHVITYYKDSKVRNIINMILVLNAEEYWKKEMSSRGDHPICEIEPFKAIRRCVRESDYSVSELKPLTQEEVAKLEEMFTDNNGLPQFNRSYYVAE